MASTHKEIDQRSLALHAGVVARLREEPGLIRIAHANLARWRRQFESDDPAMPAVREWQQLLDSLTVGELFELLQEQSERAGRLRQNSPFAGILTPSEVWKIKEDFICEESSA